MDAALEFAVSGENMDFAVSLISDGCTVPAAYNLILPI